MGNLSVTLSTSDKYMQARLRSANLVAIFMHFDAFRGTVGLILSICWSILSYFFSAFHRYFNVCWRILVGILCVGFETFGVLIYA